MTERTENAGSRWPVSKSTDREGLIASHAAMRAAMDRRMARAVGPAETARIVAIIQATTPATPEQAARAAAAILEGEGDVLGAE